MPEDFKKLNVWQKSHDLMLSVYQFTSKIPKEETYNLTSQLRRAALSVPANIAESQGRYHYAETIHFLYNARGSAEEVRSLLIAAKDLDFITKLTFKSLEADYSGLVRGINSFIKSLNARKSNKLN